VVVDHAKGDVVQVQNPRRAKPNFPKMNLQSNQSAGRFTDRLPLFKAGEAGGGISIFDLAS